MSYFYAKLPARVPRRTVLSLGALLLLHLAAGCGKRPVSTLPYSRRRCDAVLATVRSQIGVKYKLGGASPKTGFDCSGLLHWSFAQHGVAIPRTAREQASFGKPVRLAEVRAGDIVAFRVSGSWHTGIASGNRRFIHSPSSGARVREESIDSSYWRPRFGTARRVV